MQILLEEHELQECVQTNIMEVMEQQEQPYIRPEEKKAKYKALAKRVKKDRGCKSLLVSRVHYPQLKYIHDKESPKGHLGRSPLRI